MKQHDQLAEVAELWGDLRHLPPPPQWTQAREFKNERNTEKTEQMQRVFRRFLNWRFGGARRLNLSTDFKLEAFAAGRKNSLFRIEEYPDQRFVVRAINSGRKMKSQLEIRRLMSDCDIITPKVLFSDSSHTTRMLFRHCFIGEEYIEGDHPDLEQSWESGVNKMCEVSLRLKQKQSKVWGAPLRLAKQPYVSYFRETLQRHLRDLARFQLITDQQKEILKNFFSAQEKQLGEINTFYLSLPSLHPEDIIIDYKGKIFAIDIDKAVYCDDTWDIANLLFRFSNGEERKILYILQRFHDGGLSAEQWSTAGRAFLALYHLRALCMVGAVYRKRDPALAESVQGHLSELCSVLI